MDPIRAVSDHPDSAAAVSRSTVPAGVRHFLQGSGCPASVYEVADTVGAKVSYRLNVLQATAHPRTSAKRRSAAWERRGGYHPALHIEAEDVPAKRSFLPKSAGPCWSRFADGSRPVP